MTLDDALFRSAWPVVYAAAARASFGDLHAAEDATATAFERAVRRWPSHPPDNPTGWLVTVAKRAIIDAARTRAVTHRNTLRLISEDQQPSVVSERNDVLDLYFMCAHPALGNHAQVALTLRSVGGLRPAEIARALHVAPSTIEKRLVRARSKIRDAGIALRRPDDDDLDGRLAVVLRVIMLIFNEGYAPTHGDEAFRQDLCDEAIYLARTLHGEVPGHPEPRSLLALLLFLDSRRDARLVDGHLVALRFQDRTRWDHAAIDTAIGLVSASLRSPRRGVYTLRGAIAALHAEALGQDTTPWAQVAQLYDTLVEIEPSTSNATGRAVAHLEATGPKTARPLLEQLKPSDAVSRFIANLALARLHELDEQPQLARTALDVALLDAPTTADRQAIEALQLRT